MHKPTRALFLCGITTGNVLDKGLAFSWDLRVEMMKRKPHPTGNTIDVEQERIRWGCTTGRLGHFLLQHSLMSPNWFRVSTNSAKCLPLGWGSPYAGLFVFSDFWGLCSNWGSVPFSILPALVIVVDSTAQSLKTQCLASNPKETVYWICVLGQNVWPHCASVFSSAKHE